MWHKLLYRNLNLRQLKKIFLRFPLIVALHVPPKLPRERNLPRETMCAMFRSSLTHRQNHHTPPYPGSTRPGPGSSESGREDNEARAAMRITNIGQECQSVFLISGLTCGNQQQQPTH